MDKDVSREEYESLRQAFEDFKTEMAANVQYMHKILLRHQHSRSGVPYDPER